MINAFDLDDDTYIQVSIPESEDVNASENVEPIVESSDTQETFNANEANYIVGCFGELTNAENLVVKLKASGMDARIYDNNNGLHRVTAGSAISIEGYNEIKTQAEALGFKGWKLN